MTAVNPNPTTLELATLHLEVVEKLAGRDFIRAWLDGATVEVEEPVPAPTTIIEKKKRGRRPGAAADSDRCIWKMVGGKQCKNSKQDGELCNIHKDKKHLISPTP